jgi:hypothetical protein
MAFMGRSLWLLASGSGWVEDDLAVVGDLRGTVEEVVGDHGAANVLAEFDLGLVFAELAASH